MDIICLRGEGDRPGNDIVESLLSNVNAALSRGRMELDEGALADENQLETILLDLHLGQTIQVDDSTLGYFTGKLISLSHTVKMDETGNMSGSSSFTLRQPR